MSQKKSSKTGYGIDLTGKNAIVTGAGRGIGIVVARALVDAGARVLCVDQLESVTEQPASRKDAWLGLVADVSDPSSVDDMVALCLSRFGPPDILLNIAAISKPCPVKQMAIERWRETIDVNLTSVFLCTRSVLPHMLERRRGCIINFSSIIARTGGTTSAHYTAAKAGIEGFSRSLAKEVGPSGIRVNVIAPGMIETHMLELMPETQKQKLVRRIPLQRIGRPEDFIGPVLFLISDGGSYITGQTLSVNGGQYMA